ncbi:MAG: thiamine phosphate synthase [Opitutales bacterium]|nr:thiamine phosphate synthase [Opitutales bacterium]
MSELPSIILISPSSQKSGEIELLSRFFDAGLMRYHLRKPDWSADELSEFLDQVPDQHLSKIVVHRCPSLLNDFPLAGYHHTSTEDIQDVEGSCSRSLHQISELKTLKSSLDYAFFGPVYHSISKKGYTPKISLSEIFTFFKSGKLNELVKVPKIYALGGIRRKKVRKLADIGFYGVALLGSVWGSRDPVHSLNEFLKMDIEFLSNNRVQSQENASIKT